VNVHEIRQALAALLSEIPGLNVYPFVPDAPALPAVVIYPFESDFAVAFNRGTDQWRFRVQVLVSSTSDRSGQELLDELISGAGPRSLRERIYKSPTLSMDLAERTAAATVDTTAAVLGLTAYDAVTFADGTRAFSASLTVLVTTSGNA
jgi:hypothetical protein